MKNKKFLHLSAETRTKTKFMLCLWEGRKIINSKRLRKRDLYLDKLIAFQDIEPVKIVTGIRQCGKSSVLKLMVAYLK